MLATTGTRVTTCHGCRYQFLIPAARYGETVQCPDCHAFFDSDVEPPPGLFTPPSSSDTPCPDLSGSGPFLTAPHHCHACLMEADRPGAPPHLRARAEIHAAYAMRQHTTMHLACARKASLYAALYWCPRCLGRRTRLESPRWQWGQETTCPICKGTFTVPDDELLRFVEPTAERLLFHCAACRKALSANVAHAGRAAVCLFCEQVVEVPRAGREDHSTRYHRAGGTANRGPTASRRNRCPSCSLALPLKAERCPHCNPSLNP